MKCSQSRPGFELVSPYPFPTTITITPRAPPQNTVINETTTITDLLKQYEDFFGKIGNDPTAKQMINPPRNVPFGMKHKFKKELDKMSKMGIIKLASYVVPSISFQTFLDRHLKLSYTLENSVCYCYTSYEMTDKFL